MIDLQEFRNEEFSRREEHLKHAEKQKLYMSETNDEHRQIHIVYVMTHVGICGGTKICLEHVNNLARLNQKATIVSHFKKPTWFPIRGDVKYIQVPFEQELATGIPQCDVIVATYWREIYECIAREIAPVVYFEQGDFHLFSWDTVSERVKNYIHKQFQVVPFIYTVSKGASEKIMENFGRESLVINNAIDHSIFYSDFVNRRYEKREFTVIIIGSEKNEFKGIGDIKQALSILKEAGYKIKLNWVSPDKPDNPLGKVFVNPKQKHIGKLLRNSDLFISASLYESFSLPVLEAMACGCPVITTNNKGVLEYAVNNENCIMTAMSDPNELAKNIISVYEDEALADKIISGGIKTASKYSWDNIIPQILKYYQQISNYKPVV